MPGIYKCSVKPLEVKLLSDKIARVIIEVKRGDAALERKVYRLDR